VTPFDVANGAKASNHHYRKGSSEGNAIFSSQVHYLDHLVGKILRCVEETGQADNTIVIFTSDNGTTSSAKGKGVEFGVHVPFVVVGPGIKQRGMASALMDFTDVLPTLADFAGAQLQPGQKVDGISLVPFLKGESEESKDVIYSFPGVSRIVRTRDYLLEAVTPFYGYPKGRFYKTHGGFDGKTYENITHDPEFRGLREGRFQNLLDDMVYPLPGSSDDPKWKSNSVLQQGHKYFTAKNRKSQHLDLPRYYQFYDPSF
jgi:arylsulfatase A-like enzyme